MLIIDFFLKQVSEKCNGKPRCDLYASNKVFGDPCPMNYKYLDLVWQCVQ